VCVVRITVLVLPQIRHGIHGEPCKHLYRWLGDRGGMFRITVISITLMARGYWLLGARQPMQALLGSLCTSLGPPGFD